MTGKLASGLFPLENDMKPMLNDPATLSTDPASADNPDNWIVWGSFGVMSAFNYLSSVTRCEHAVPGGCSSDQRHPAELGAASSPTRTRSVGRSTTSR